MSSDTLPGMTIYNNSLDYYILPYKGNKSEKIILLSCPSFDLTKLFNNGLVQNILILYTLFENIGYVPYLLVHSITNDFMKQYRCIIPEDYLLHQFRVYLYIEVGMSVEKMFVDRLHSSGTRCVKLYLGNTCNIDIENITIAHYIQFPHHTHNTFNEIWTSPHYAQNLEYLCALYSVPFCCGKIAPYVWDSCFIDLKKQTYSKKQWQETDIVIVEPNISFQKCAFLPLFLCESFAKIYPEWKGRVYCYNTLHLEANIHAQKNIFDRLLLYQSGRVQKLGRVGVHEILDRHSSAVFISHQINNEFNYLLLELMWKGFPVMHTSNAWKQFGYFWTESAWQSAIDTLRKVLEKHTSIESSGKVLCWNHSIHNPILQQRWKELIESK
jgi:hypothetical protein